VPCLVYIRGAFTWDASQCPKEDILPSPMISELYELNERLGEIVEAASPSLQREVGVLAASGEVMPLLSPQMVASPTAMQQASPALFTSSLGQAVSQLTPAEKRSYAEEAVLRVVHELTGLRTRSDTPLIDVGVDSVVAIEFASHLCSVTGLTLTPTIAFEQPTSRAVAAHLLELVCVPSLAALTFRYEVAPELPDELTWLSRAPAGAPPIVIVHDFTGLLWGVSTLAEALHAPCLGIRCSSHLLDGCKTMEQLARRYVRLLPKEMRNPVRLVGYSLGCRIAFRMACVLEGMGEPTQLLLLDGPVGPESEGPARMGDLALMLAEKIRSTREEEQLEGLLDMLTSAGNETASVAATLLDMADPDPVPDAAARVAALHVSAESSPNRSNGSVNVAQQCLPKLECVTVAGGHFDFIRTSADAIAAQVDDHFVDNFYYQ